MAGHAYKTPGLIRAGFQYQDLVAIETLIDFYRDRTAYRWVKIDADDEAFRSIEDVVACLPDGRYDLTQVKFTADPENPANSLGWAWLTARTKRGRSLLQKWSKTTLEHREAGTLARALLKTDRKPDEAFVSLLDGAYVRYDDAPPEIRATVDSQIGSADQARAFFETFQFVHSCPHIDELEKRLWSRIAADTDGGGWAAFRLAVQEWGTLKNRPGPDGRILYRHLQQAFSVERPRPIPQGFEVPPGYDVPDKAFDADFLSEITGTDGVTVLWGPPGRGKSTYLSHCVARIDPKAAVCVRHHYFLSLDDASEGRFHYQAIARSLEHQLEEAIPGLRGSRQTIGDLIRAAANYLAAEGRRLVVVVDGLDHVWRENRDHEQMEEVFNALLPLPSNVRLVVGTQKIAPAHLPARLLNVLPMDQWPELPLMSREALTRWLERQLKAGRLQLAKEDWSTDAGTLSAAADGFYDITRGLPLHLIYSFEAVARPGAPVSPADIAALPACPTGDIRDYYRSFWSRLEPRAQAILHVMAGLSFAPPPFAMGACFGLSDESLQAVAAISHLLDYRDTEVRPFHGSLFAFVQDLPGHAAAFTTHAPAVRDWLETGAPDYWRWAWLWITRAQLGDAADLVNVPDRPWAIDALMRGFPIDQVVTILDHAERHAFGAFNLPRTLELRCLKIRALNGPEFQAYDSWALFPEVALSLAGDPYGHALLRSNIGQVDAGLLPWVVRSSDVSIRTDLANRAIDDLNQRITRRSDDGIARSDRQQTMARAIAGVVAHLGPRDTPRLVRFARRSSMADTLVALYAREALLAGNLDNVFRAGELFSGRDTDREVLGALCLEGLSPAVKPDLKATSHSAVRCLAIVKGDAPARARPKPDPAPLFAGSEGSDRGFYDGTRYRLYDLFFSSLAAGLAGHRAGVTATLPEGAEDRWLGGAVRAFESLAASVAARWKTSRTWATLKDVHDGFTHPALHGVSWEAQREFIAVRLALQDVAIDLLLLGRALDPGAAIGADDLLAARSSGYWLDSLWLDAFCERRMPLHTPTAARAFVMACGEALDRTVTQFDERTSEAVKLAMLAADHGAEDLARAELRRAVDSLLAYGYRKDPFAFEVLEALDMMSKVDAPMVCKALLDLAGTYEKITDYTDGDETDHAKEQYFSLLTRLCPQRAPGLYGLLVEEEDWRYAEAVTAALIASDVLETAPGQALLETFLEGPERGALAGVATSDRPFATGALAAVRKKIGSTANGGAVPTTAIDDATETSAEEAALSPADFPPGRLGEFLTQVNGLNDYERRRAMVSDWLRHWDGTGQGAAALAVFQTEATAIRLRFDIETALDTAFEISSRVQGRTAAFAWLVRAHVLRYGWQRWFTSNDEAEARLRIAARQYPERWREFVTGTSKSVLSLRENAGGVVIGLSRLVFFLLEVGEIDLARTYVQTLVDILRAEVSGQPIRAPEWAA
ncbi:ATP-binding protein [Brevundimonas diminuta]|uniref:AAA family ATPase n=1 Tax=Brevundimonas diminuta TaxID=293 RepID=UPI001905FAF1|nr:ATP-binding protein [Brevundimonas diminuta]MBK1969765.1 ATP-binding protein [Brevundimonas diminuta]MDA0743222.1 ATP-binding protein [Pseudomonadota bacterium]MDA1321602.1 ATP-binding protein [Pseudomonadota bacterium]